ncbi:MFS transporter [Acidocella aminolytica]|jgi:MFS family permease|uniref:Major facilitator superfamily transporter n=1 Tax=Acidocella aminolytica 101 = DSM 11237 TaxID=1120923 RepID=A0A0D6PJH2_9PROT|nr:MFS transporter [Acidocella aminolytica]GAN81925.1 major facilitator superfamily transporter [Acidocella aminolytica 101 = DSM 11237]GBQ38165.1 major facilitator superfamily transporter [Acidocella aminolytica 101 = DSM 11237]SHE76973.1 Sugar phosphate permease [Acidocella aminolytica 101 = DSM 11237]
MKGKYRWVVGGFLFAASTLNYLDRSALAIVAPLVRHDLHLSISQLGLIFSIFFLGYAAFNFIGGYLSDHYGPKRIYALGMGVWSLFSGLTAIATGFWQLMLFRIFFGFGEGPMGSVSNKTVRNWFPQNEAGFMVGVATSGGNLFGAAISGPIIGLVALSYGWRVAFIATMILGFVWLVGWSLFIHDKPAQSRFVHAQETAYIENGRTAALSHGHEATPLRTYLLSATILAIALAFFAANYTQYFLLSWMPSYLVSARGLNIKTMSFVTVIPWLAGLLGCILGGLISDRLVKATRGAIFGRKIIIIATLLPVALSLILLMYAKTTFEAVGLMAFVLFLEGMTPLACWAAIQDLVPAQRVGAVSGFVHLLSNVAGIIGPGLTGFIIQYWGGYNMAFLIASLVAVVGACAVAVFVRNQSQALPVEYIAGRPANSDR